MIKIKKGYFPYVKKVIFEHTSPAGRKYENYIEAHRDLGGDKAHLNIPAIGTLHLEDVAEFIEAIKLAALIASGE
jgi:hypothetical protein